MERRVLWMVLLMLGTALSVTSCGDDGGDDGAPAAGKSGSSSTQAGRGSSMMTVCEANEVTCGTKCCGQAPGVTAAPCCSDEFTGECGMKGGFGMSQACVVAVKPHATCPSITIPFIGFVLPSCCAAGMCGIDGGIFGFDGCTELSEARRMAEEMIRDAIPPSDEDGGVAGAGGMSGGAGRGGFPMPMIMWPEPQACTM